MITLDLDLPTRTTYDYEGPTVEPRVQAALTNAFNDDQEEVELKAE